MPIAEPGGVARGCSQRSGTGGAAAEGGVRAARGSVRAARGECPRRPGKPAAATGGGPRRAGVFAEARETYPRRPGTCPRRPGAVQDGPGCSRRPGRPILAVREPVRGNRQGFCPRRPAGVLSAATGRGSVRGNRRGSAEADRFAASPTYSCRPGAVLAARGSPAYSRRSMTSSM